MLLLLFVVWGLVVFVLVLALEFLDQGGDFLLTDDHGVGRLAVLLREGFLVVAHVDYQGGGDALTDCLEVGVLFVGDDELRDAGLVLFEFVDVLEVVDVACVELANG